MTRLLHISDTHFGTERPHVMDALVAWTHEHRPDVLVFSGDITQRARRAQFDAARAFVDRLSVPRVLVVPGNHDIPLFDVIARVWRPYAGYARVFGSDLEPVIDVDRWLVVGVNTTRASRHKHGVIDAAQVDRVAAWLRAARADQLRVVVTHQPCAVPRPDARRDMVRGHDEALRAWSRAGADLVLGGHIHLPGVMRWPDQGSDHTGRSLHVALAGTAVSTRVRPEVGNSFNLVTHDVARGWADVERWDHRVVAPAATSAPGWQRVQVTRFGIDRRGVSGASAAS